MRTITAKPATPLTFLGVLFWAPNTRLLGFGASGATWIVALVMLVPFAYCTYRLFRAPLDGAWWVTALVSVTVGLLGAIGLTSSLAASYITWQDTIWAIAVFACFAYAARNWMMLRTA